MESGRAADRRVTERRVTPLRDASIHSSLPTASELLIGRADLVSGNLEPVWSLATRWTPRREIPSLRSLKWHVLLYSDFRRILPAN